MEQYHLNAKFFPAVEPKNGFIGSANVTIANAVRLDNISVFENREGGGYHIDFPGFGEQGTNYVVPMSKERYAQLLDVVERAVGDEKDHFAWSEGRNRPYLTVDGHPVNEPYADCRFSVQVADICTLYGITTRQVDYTKENGDPGHFISVDVPTRDPYEKDGSLVYPPVFEFLKDARDKDHVKDYGVLARNLIKNKREELLEQSREGHDHPPLNNRINEAQQRSSAASAKDTPAKEAEFAH